MARERPTVVTVFGILNLVFGGLFGLCSLCAGFALLFAYIAFKSAPPQAAAELSGVFGSLDRLLPSYKYVLIASVVIGLILDIVLIVSGIGLLRMHPWGRWGSVFYGVGTVLVGIAGLVYNVGYANPAMYKWQQEFQKDLAAKQKARGGPAQPMPQASANPAATTAQQIAGSVISMAYAIAVLIAMFLPQVSAAFAGGPAPRLDEERPYPEGGGQRQEGGPDYGIQPYR
jgi:hypothetical protein